MICRFENDRTERILQKPRGNSPGKAIPHDFQGLLLVGMNHRPSHPSLFQTVFPPTSIQVSTGVDSDSLL